MNDKLTILCQIRKAKYTDFYNGYPKDHALYRLFLGKQYFLINASGQPEAYTTNENTNWKELARFIDMGRCYVFQPASLQFESEIRIVGRSEKKKLQKNSASFFYQMKRRLTDINSTSLPASAPGDFD